jgi:hypothetical protein
MNAKHFKSSLRLLAVIFLAFLTAVAIAAYFKDCEEKRLMPNKAGLCLHLKITKETYNQYKTKFSDLIKADEHFIENAPPASTQSFATDVKHLNHHLRHIDGSRSVAQDARVSEHGLRNHMPTALNLVKGNDRRRSARPQEPIR